MGHALRLMVARENTLDGTVEISTISISVEPTKAIGLRTSEPGPERAK